MPSEVSDLIQTRMTFDDFDTWEVICSRFVGSDWKSGISFALNNDPEAQDSSKTRIITAEMGRGNGTWKEWSCMTLTPGKLYMAPRYPLTPIMLPAMQKHTPESNYAACNAKAHSRKQLKSPRSQNPPILSEHDLTYDVITSWPDISGWKSIFQDICPID